MSFIHFVGKTTRKRHQQRQEVTVPCQETFTACKTTACLCCITHLCDSADFPQLESSDSEDQWVGSESQTGEPDVVLLQLNSLHDQTSLNTACNCFINSWSECTSFHVVNISRESADHPQMSGNLVNKDTPDPQTVEQLVVVLVKLVLQLALLEFLCDVGVRKRLLSVNHFRCQPVYLLLLYIKTHMCVLVSPRNIF